MRPPALPLGISVLVAALLVSACEDTAAVEAQDPFGFAEREEVEKKQVGFNCTDDCSGHEAGYEWAEANNVKHPDDCSGKSESFIEGCEAYAATVAEDAGAGDTEKPDVGLF
jgi:hypothetical protein